MKEVGHRTTHGPGTTAAGLAAIRTVLATRPLRCETRFLGDGPPSRFASSIAR